MSSIIDDVSARVASVIADPQGFARSKLKGIEKYVNYVANHYFQDMEKVLRASYSEERIGGSDGFMEILFKEVTNAVGKKVVNWTKERYIQEMVKAAITASLVSVAVAGIFWISAGAAAGVILGTLTFVPTAFGIHSYQMFRNDPRNILPNL